MNNIQTMPEHDIIDLQDPPFDVVESDDRAFIQANTIKGCLDEIRNQHIIPVFAKDNEMTISHIDFIETMQNCVQEHFNGETFLQPSVRLSHPVKGRIPEAKFKSAKELAEHEKTLYYERMAFVIEIPTVTEVIGGNELKLMAGGVKAYNHDNLYNRKGADERFKIFCGFQNTVCTNLCVWSDGFTGELKVKSVAQLQEGILDILNGYSMQQHIGFMNSLESYSLSEPQFAQLIGRCRLYQYLSPQDKVQIPGIQLSDTQLNMVVRDYYRDKSFCRDGEGNINLWRLYNLFTGANKSSYIDTFLERSVSACSFTASIKHAIANKEDNWFLN